MSKRCNEGTCYGFPSPAADYEEEALDLNAYVVHNRTATFHFTVASHSVKGAGIFEGDRVAVDRSVTPHRGHLVVAQENIHHPGQKTALRSIAVPIAN
ncbi:MAG TPA: S24 family peptidase [Paucimonas sp.]|nr:S24 family peptidase [Paucimonas sp.]HJW55990.1 S24 family peptidase [Burkholderiaceae bacterium]